LAHQVSELGAGIACGEMLAGPTFIQKVIRGAIGDAFQRQTRTEIILKLLQSRE